MSIAKRFTGKRAYPAKANSVLAGNLVVLLAAGLAIPVDGAAATAKCAGVATFSVDNTGGADGAVRVEVEVGEHKFVNADIVVADVGETAYFVDARTVSSDDDTGARPAAGKIVQVDEDGVWIEIGV